MLSKKLFDEFYKTLKSKKELIQFFGFEKLNVSGSKIDEMILEQIQGFGYTSYIIYSEGMKRIHKSCWAHNPTIVGLTPTLATT